MNASEDLIDRIYEASVAPDLWPGVLDRLAGLSGSQGGLLFSARKVLNWTASDAVRGVFEAYVSDGWFARCPRRPCLMSRDAPSFFVEQDFWSEEEILSNPIYRDFFRPHGLGWSAGTGLSVPTGDSIVFSVERAFGLGPLEREDIERLNEFRPHLARSALVTARLGLERARGAGEALGRLRLPALLLDGHGSVVETNAEAQALPDEVRFGPNNRLVLTDRRAAAQLSAALAAIGAGAAQAKGMTFPLRDASGAPARVLHVMPVERSAHDIFGGSYALLMMTPVAGERAPSADLLRSLFDLTASEARVARGIAEGLTPEAIAGEGGVSIATVRSQLRKVLEKTGCTRQAEVAALLARVALAPEQAGGVSSI